MVIINDEPTIIDLKTETAAEVAEPAEEVAEPEEPVEPPTLKRKPGRPPGSKSKEPGKPRAKRVILQEVVEPIAQEPETNAYTMRIPSRHECVYNDTSAKMLQMLSDHSQSRKKRKTDLWRSWFN